MVFNSYISRVTLLSVANLVDQLLSILDPLVFEADRRVAFDYMVVASGTVSVQVIVQSTNRYHQGRPSP